MTIVERMMDAAIRTMSTEGEWRPTIRAALRAVRPEDVSDGQLEAFTRVMPAHYLPQSKYAANLRRAIAAALAAGAET